MLSVLPHSELTDCCAPSRAQLQSFCLANSLPGGGDVATMNVAVVEEALRALTNEHGGFAGDGGDELALRLVSDRCVVDAEAPCAYTALCRR